jgi:hypothetical protein
MLKKITFLMIIIFTFSFMIACPTGPDGGDSGDSGDGGDGGDGGDVNVYIAGYQKLPDGDAEDESAARVWFNEFDETQSPNVIDLSYLGTSAEGARARGVYVHDNGDVYATGYDRYQTEFWDTPVYWKFDGSNITAFNLLEPNDTGDPEGNAWGVTAEGDNLYVAGYYENANGRFIACYWINPLSATDTSGLTRVDLMDSNEADEKANVYNLFIKDGYIYVVASMTEGIERRIVYWKNDITDTTGYGGTTLQRYDIIQPPEEGYAFDIHVTDTDVYLAGHYSTDGNEFNGVYWKNPVSATDTSGIEMFSTGDVISAGSYSPLGMDVVDGDVYIGASYKNASDYSVPAYWVDEGADGVDITRYDNGFDTGFDPTQTSGYIRDIKVVNNKAYLMGYYESQLSTQNIIVYWVHDLNTPTDPPIEYVASDPENYDNSAICRSIFVTTN